MINIEDKTKNIKIEYPIPQRHIRLYRGSSSTRDIKKAPFIKELFPEMEEIAARWFTDNLEDAMYYTTTTKGEPRLFFIDIPEDKIEEYRVSNIPKYKHLAFKPQNEFIVPIIYFQHLREISLT